VYRGSLAGLTVAEVEFPSAGESAQLTTPPWFGTEVAEDEAYKNVNLALHGRPGRVRAPRGADARGDPG
jgi:CYTH domain-containing protein